MNAKERSKVFRSEAKQRRVTIASSSSAARITLPVEHQLVGDVRGQDVEPAFLVALAALMRRHQVSKVDIAWGVIPPEASRDTGLL